MTAKFRWAALAVLAVAGSVQAGGPTLVGPDPVPAVSPPAPATGVDWSGPYAGLSYGRTSGSFEIASGTVLNYLDGHATGVFLGYNLQRGQLVFGGELSYATVSGMVADDAGFGNDDTLDSLLELRGRLGVSLGNALVYGAVGLSKGNYTINTVDKPTASGTSVGLGMDYLLTDQIFVGIDYTRRKMDGSNDNPGNTFDFDGPTESMSLRLGMSF